MKQNQVFFIIFACVLLFFPVRATFAHPGDVPPIQSETAILIDANSGQILYEKDAKQRMYPASITKIVTGIMAIELGDLDEAVTVSQEATEVVGTRVYLVEGEEIELKRLVQGLLINSGNDAGTVIAEYFSGSEKEFAKEMNEFVKKRIGVTETNFTNPHGLFNEDHYTTAYDMAKIAQYAMNNEVFREIVGTKELEWNGQEWQTTLYNHHRLLWDYEGVTGIKNGFVSRSGFTLVTSAERDGMELIAVTLNALTSQHANDDTTALLNYGFDTYITKQLSAHKIREDGLGGQYKLFSDVFVTIVRDEHITKKVRNGMLQLTTEDDTVLFEQPLKKLVNPLQEKRAENALMQDERKSLNFFEQMIHFFNIFK